MEIAEGNVDNTPYVKQHGDDKTWIYSLPSECLQLTSTTSPSRDQGLPLVESPSSWNYADKLLAYSQIYDIYLFVYSRSH